MDIDNFRHSNDEIILLGYFLKFGINEASIKKGHSNNSLSKRFQKTEDIILISNQMQKFFSVQ